jgi:hypothetical protein
MSVSKQWWAIVPWRTRPEATAGHKGVSAALPMRAIVGSVLVLAGAVFLYSIWLPHTYSSDDLQYAMAIAVASTGEIYYHPAGGQPYTPASATPPAAGRPRVPLNPRYVLEMPTSVAVVGVWRLLGWAGTNILPILTFRIMVGALGLFCFYWAIFTVFAHIRLAVLASAGLGTSVAYWTYSTHLDQSMTMVALLCLAFWFLARQLRATSPAHSRLLLIVLALATLYNFTAILTVPVFAAILAALSPDARLAGWLRRWVGFVGGYSAMVIGAVVLAITIGAPPASLISPAFWRAVTFAGHPEYQVSIVRDGARAALALAKAQVIHPQAAGALQDYWNTTSFGSRLALVSFYGLTLLLMAIPVLYLVSRWRRLQRRRLFLLLLGWMLVYSAFNWWWDPGYIKYWLVPLVAWWAIVALALHTLRHEHPRRFQPALLLTATLIALMFLGNLTTQFLPQRDERANPWPAVAQTLGQSRPDALFISADAHPLDFYIAYFARRDIVSVPLIRYGTGGDEDSVKQVVADHIRQHRTVGGPIYVYSSGTLPPNRDDEALGLSAQDQLRPAWVFPGLTIYEVVREPAR